MGMFGPKFKKSFGTALKFVGPDLWPNVATYGLAGVLGAASTGDAVFAEKWAAARERIQQATLQMQPLAQQFQQQTFPQQAFPQPYQQAFPQPYQQPYQQTYQSFQPAPQQSWIRR